MPAVKNPPAIQETHKTWVQSQGQADPLEEEMAIHSSVPAWEILWAEEPGQLQSTGSQRVGHTTEHTKLNAYHSSECCTPCPLERLRFHFSLSCSGGGNGNPLQYSCLENLMGRGAWPATVHRVEKRQTWLKLLSMHAQSQKTAESMIWGVNLDTSQE